jgi:hypothetical protein
VGRSETDHWTTALRQGTTESRIPLQPAKSILKSFFIGDRRSFPHGALTFAQSLSDVAVMEFGLDMAKQKKPRMGSDSILPEMS